MSAGTLSPAFIFTVSPTTTSPESISFHSPSRRTHTEGVTISESSCEMSRPLSSCTSLTAMPITIIIRSMTAVTPAVPRSRSSAKSVTSETIAITRNMIIYGLTMARRTLRPTVSSRLPVSTFAPYNSLLSFACSSEYPSSETSKSVFSFSVLSWAYSYIRRC